MTYIHCPHAEPARWSRRVAIATVAIVVAGALEAGRAEAACNLIPGVPGTFRSALGMANRPFAVPGDVIEIAVRPTVCDTASAGLVSRRVGDYVASVIFTPPSGPLARTNVVVVASYCATLAEKLRACEARPDVAAATCLEAQRPGEARSLALVNRNGERRLSLRFPDTDALVGTATDGRTLSGPATIAVTTRGAPLPCELATTRCADVAQPGLVACVDELFRGDGSCRTDRAHTDGTFAHFTALPPPNDYRAILASSSASVAATSEVRFTVDGAGNLLIPIDWRGASVTTASTYAHRLRGAHTVAALLERTGPIALPSRSFVASYTPTGAALPAMFEPDTRANTPSLFGTTDVSFSVLRLARRAARLEVCAHGPRSGQPCTGVDQCPDGTCGSARCTSGARAGQTCSADAECPTGECGRGLFEFRDRFTAGVGPVIIPEPAPEPAHEACRLPAGDDGRPAVL